MLRGPFDTLPYRFLRVWVPAVLRVVFRMRVYGTEHIPRDGAVVLAANHRSNLDPIFIGAAATRQVHFMAKAELWSFAPVGWLIDGLGSFPVHRGKADRAAVKRALGVLDGGGVLGLFPEGHRQRDGILGQPQPGVALFALRPGVATIPVALDGTERIVRGGIPRLPRVSVTFGPPVDPSVPDVTKSERHTEVAHRIMRSLARLLGRRWTPPAASPGPSGHSNGSGGEDDHTDAT